MMYLCAIFIPPVYFFIRKNWGAFAINSILYGLACLCVITLIGIWLAPVFWIPSVAHAMWFLRKEMLEEHAEMISTKMAEKMRQQG